MTGVATSRHVAWSALPSKAKAWRLVHATWSVAQLACLGYIWASAVAGRRDAAVWASIAFVSAEGGALVIGGGDCPVGRLQADWGDPVPFFELVLPPRAAKAAIPALAIASVVGIALIALLPPGLVRRSR